MRTIEIRRHTERHENQDLTAKGIEIAAKARETLELPYDAYYVSPKKRARLTMEAFGISDAVVEARLDQRPRPPFVPFEPQWKALRDSGLDAVTAWFAIPEVVPVMNLFGEQALQGVLEIAAKLTEDGKALAVSHGGTIEPFAVVATGQPYASIFGNRELGYCEGVKTFLTEGRVTRVDVIRLPQS